MRTQRNELISLATHIDEKLKVKINKPGKDPLNALKEIRKSQLKLLEALPVPESVLKILQSQNNLYDEAMMQIVR